MSLKPDTITTSSQAAAVHVDGGAEPPSRVAPSPQTRLEVESIAGLAQRIDLEWLRAQLASAASAVEDLAGRPIECVGVRIVDDPRMTTLHQQHLGHARTTDVLSFDLSAGTAPTGGTINADIAVNADEAARRAAEFGHSVERELLLYAIHGLLHCAGFDDADDAGFAAMHAREDQILESIGVGPTFRSASGDGESHA